jgi:hypothetical protein
MFDSVDWESPGTPKGARCRRPSSPDTSVIRDGKHRELEVAMKRLAVFVEQKMPRVIS